MASEQVRQASKILGPLLRRRGTSPALGATLRRALGALDKSLSGLDGQKQEEVVQAGISELRACLALIQASDRPADHAQVDGINKALAILAPPEAPGTESEAASILHIAPPIDQAAAHGPPSERSDVASKDSRKRRPTRATTLDFQTVDTQLLGLAAKFGLLHVVLSEPLFRLGDVDAANAELRKHVQAMRWLGGDRAPEILHAIDTAGNVEDRLVAGAALVHLGADRGVEWLMTILDGAVAAKQPFPAIGATILRTLSSASFLDAALQVFLKPARPAVCGVLLPLLAEQRLLPPERLWELVRHPSDEVAIPAAQALAWTDGGPYTPMLLGWVGKARTAKRANALLFAAVGLGSRTALAEVRCRLHRGGDFDPQLVDALAVAGGRSDAALLMSLAARPDVDASYVVLASAHLGCVETLEAMSPLAERVPTDVVEEARRMIVGGTRPQNNDEGRADPTCRSLRGRPWSVSAVLDRLAENDEPLQSRLRLALELRVRTGLTIPTALPTLVPAEDRAKLAAHWTSHFAKANSRLKPGGWYYQGGPATAPARVSQS